MDLKLTGKLALVTGSTAGIGFAIAEALAREGACILRTHGHFPRPRSPYARARPPGRAHDLSRIRTIIAA
jgi:NAD(P)-dependent dehydrogenase (short-subunit alcohol dehydrogenase family)